MVTQPYDNVYKTWGKFLLYHDTNIQTWSKMATKERTSVNVLGSNLEVVQL